MPSPLEDRLARLEAAQQEPVGIDRIPFTSLIRKLEAEWSPDATSLLARGTATNAIIGENSIGPSELKPNSVSAVHIVSGAAAADELGLQTVVSLANLNFNAPNTGPTRPNYDTEVLDTEAIYNVGTPAAAVTLVRPGFYVVIGLAEFPADAVGQREVGVAINGTDQTLQRVDAAAAGVTVLSGIWAGQLAATNTLAAYVNHNSTTTPLVACKLRLILGRISG